MTEFEAHANALRAFMEANIPRDKHDEFHDEFYQLVEAACNAAAKLWVDVAVSKMEEFMSGHGLAVPSVLRASIPFSRN